VLIDEELLSFMEGVKAPTSLKRDGTARKARENDPVIRQRNLDVVLSHFGFGDEDSAWLTLEELAGRYDGLTRERIRQIIEITYSNHLPKTPLPVATAVAAVLAEREIWLEADLIEALAQAGHIGDLEHTVGLLAYLQSQGLATSYNIYLSSLQRATRSIYRSDAEIFVARDRRVVMLRNDLKAAQRLPGRSGLAKLSNVKRRGAAIDREGLTSLLTIGKDAWSGVHQGELWYSFEDRENVLVNEAATTFAVTDQCHVDDLAKLLSQALLKRAAPDEYPPVDLVRTWITQSRHFTVTNGIASFNGETRSLNPVENALVRVAKGKVAQPLKLITDKLVGQGFTPPNAHKNVYNSPFLLIDKSRGRGSYTGTLVSDLSKATVPLTDRYDLYLARLAALGGTDREARSTARREQGILAEWVFGREAHADCAACGRMFARRALVVAHKKKRNRCTDQERLDPYIVFPLCVFGCDHLYEHGYISVKNGIFCLGKATAGQTESAVVKALKDRAVPERWLRGPAAYFDNL
jgi:hypothetical protein